MKIKQAKRSKACAISGRGAVAGENIGGTPARFFASLFHCTTALLSWSLEQATLTSLGD